MKKFILFFLIICIFISGCHKKRFDYVEYSKTLPIKNLEIQPILIENGDFEKGNSSWIFFLPQNLRIVEKAGRNESKGLIINSSFDNQYDGFHQIITNTAKLSTILFEGWIKTSGLKGIAKYNIGCLNPEIMYDPNGREIYGGLYGQDSKGFSGDTPWTKVQMIVTIPIQTKTINILGRVEATEGTSYFDDILVKGISVYDSDKDSEKK